MSGISGGRSFGTWLPAGSQSHIDTEAIRTEMYRRPIRDMLVGALYIMGLMCSGVAGYLTGQHVSENLSFWFSVGFVALYVVGLAAVKRLLER